MADVRQEATDFLFSAMTLITTDALEELPTATVSILRAAAARVVDVLEVDLQRRGLS